MRGDLSRTHLSENKRVAAAVARELFQRIFLLWHFGAHRAEIDGYSDSSDQDAQADHDPPNRRFKTVRPEKPEKNKSGRQVCKSPEDVDERRGFGWRRVTETD